MSDHALVRQMTADERDRLDGGLNTTRLVCIDCGEIFEPGTIRVRDRERAVIAAAQWRCRPCERTDRDRPRAWQPTTGPLPACPRASCGAELGERCKDRSGREVSPHAARIQLHEGRTNLSSSDKTAKARGAVWNTIGFRCPGACGRTYGPATTRIVKYDGRWICLADYETAVGLNAGEGTRPTPRSESFLREVDRQRRLSRPRRR